MPTVNLIAARFSDYMCHWPSGVDYGPRFTGIKQEIIPTLAKTVIEMSQFVRIDGPVESYFLVITENGGLARLETLQDVKDHFKRSK